MKSFVLAGMLVLSSTLPVLAKPVYPTEKQLWMYEFKLATFFSNPEMAKRNGAYLRKSDSQRRKDGQLACGLINDTSVAAYIAGELKIIESSYGNNPKRETDETAYLLGVTIAAIDSMCSENRAELIDLLDRLEER